MQNHTTQTKKKMTQAKVFRRQTVRRYSRQDKSVFVLSILSVKQCEEHTSAFSHTSEIKMYQSKIISGIISISIKARLYVVSLVYLSISLKGSSIKVFPKRVKSIQTFFYKKFTWDFFSIYFHYLILSSVLYVGCIWLIQHE